ncbi:hypothetical protein BDZ89DRAFT_1051028 [Hymenopellis radicata]|nr:hypothetical protein BDZ89DRAFT_1051028 [Hymenopellis radicata]
MPNRGVRKHRGWEELRAQSRRWPKKKMMRVQPVGGKCGKAATNVDVISKGGADMLHSSGNESEEMAVHLNEGVVLFMNGVVRLAAVLAPEPEAGTIGRTSREPRTTARRSKGRVGSSWDGEQTRRRNFSWSVR